MATEKYRYPAAGKWTSNKDNHIVGAVVNKTSDPFWGCGGGGNSRSVYETAAGRSLGLYRHYGSTDITAAVNQAKADAAKGTVTWVSIKRAASEWGLVGNGGDEAWCQSIANQFATVPGPVMLTINHEPEGDGVLADWIKMHDHVYAYTQNKPNIMFGPILTGYNWVIDPNPAYKLDSSWPGAFNSGDFIGFDDYNYYGAYASQQAYIDKTGTINHNWTELPAKYFAPLSTWAKKKGIKWAIGEFALTHEAADFDLSQHGNVTWLHNVYDWAKAEGNCLALNYFDSIISSRGDWTINNYTPGQFIASAATKGHTKKSEFVSILQQSPPWRPLW